LAYVYWIHLPTHTDILTQGYVGVTSLSVKDRYTRHLSAANSKGITRIINAIKSHKDILVCDTLISGDIDYCYYMENTLRSSEKIGWNLATGGKYTREGCENTPDHILKVSKKNTGKKRTSKCNEENRKRGVLQYSFEFPWQHPYSNKDAWKSSLIIYPFVVEQGMGRRSIGRMLNIGSDSVMKVINKIKSGWNPSEDTAYMSWLKLQEGTE